MNLRGSQKKVVLTALALFGVWSSACNIVRTPTATAPDISTTPPPHPTLTHEESISVPEFRGRVYRNLVHVTGQLPGRAYDVDVALETDEIVFVSDGFSKDPKLFIQSIHGGTPRQLTAGAGADIQPKYSPDGKYIAYPSNREGTFDIYVREADGSGAPWRITDGRWDELHPSWNPEGTHLAYCAPDERGIWTIWVVELDGLVHTQLIPGFNPEWSPDGQRLAFQSPNSQGTASDGIWVIGIDGGQLRPVVVDPRFGAIEPSWDPYGERLVFTSTERVSSKDQLTDRSDLWVVGLDGAPPYRLLDHGHRDYAPAWGLDGRIYFTSHRSGTDQIFSIRAPRLDSPFDSDNSALPEESR